MIEYIIIFMTLLIFSIIMICGNKGVKPAYGKIVVGIIVPVIVACTTWIVIRLLGRMIPGDILNVVIATILSPLRWIVVSVVNMWACCFIYKATTRSEHGILVIWGLDFKKWNVAACASILLGGIAIIVNNVLLLHHLLILTKALEGQTSMIDYLADANLLTAANGIMIGMEFGFEFLTMLCMIIPAFLQKEAIEEQ